MQSKVIWVLVVANFLFILFSVIHCFFVKGDISSFYIAAYIENYDTESGLYIIGQPYIHDESNPRASQNPRCVICDNLTPSPVYGKEYVIEIDENCNCKNIAELGENSDRVKAGRIPLACKEIHRLVENHSGMGFHTKRHLVSNALLLNNGLYRAYFKSDGGSVDTLLFNSAIKNSLDGLLNISVTTTSLTDNVKAIGFFVEIDDKLPMQIIAVSNTHNHKVNE